MKFKKLPNIDRRAYKGIFKPNNPQKYKGNVKNITYRSSWEKRFMVYCDKTRQIVEWGSEELFIPTEVLTTNLIDIILTSI